MRHSIDYTLPYLKQTLRHTIDETTTRRDVEQAVPLFFKGHLGRRETISLYRGFLIVRYTVGTPADARQGHYHARRTVVYLFDPEKQYTLHVDVDAKNARQAKRLIDTIIKTGKVEAV